MLKTIIKQGHFEGSVMFPAKTLSLHSMLVCCGFQEATSLRYNFNGFQRGRKDLSIWQYTISGFGRLECEGRTYDITPGKAMLIHVPQDHCYYLPEDSDSWEFFYLSCNGREFMRVWSDIEKRVGPVADFSEDSRTMKVIVEILTLVRDGRLNSSFTASSLAYRFAMALLEDFPSGPKGKSDRAVIRKVIDYCMDHISEPINVDDLAEVSGYSRYHFSRLFSSAQGMSPGAFVKDLRLKHAERLLQTELMSVKEIADACGFEDDSYFCKAFRKAYKMSPGEYRKSGG
jgi:AraC-like DNA-binding protein